MEHSNEETSHKVEATSPAMAASILFVEPNHELRASRCLLLSCLNVGVTVVTDPLGVFKCPKDDSFVLIVISMREAAEAMSIAAYARQRWPDALILLLGESSRDLEDAFYDDIVDPRCNPVGFLETSRRLLKQQHPGGP